jgi:ankyrin repeat protein
LDLQQQFDDAHAIAKKGDVRLLRRLARIGPPKALHKPDKAGWHPLHEAVRAGHVESVQFLLLNGADVNHATRSGHTPLDIAKSEFGADHEMIKFLTKMGAHEMSKFLTEKGAVGLGPDL